MSSLLQEISNYKKMHTCRAKAKPEDLESIFQNCPEDETNASYWILVPFHYNEEYSLYSFDMKQRSITVMEPGADKIEPIKQIHRIQKIGKNFDRAMELLDDKWNDDVYDWKRYYPGYVPKTTDM